MINTNKVPVRLSTTDTLMFTDNLDVKADACYELGIWTVKASVTGTGRVGDQEVVSVKVLEIPTTFLTGLDTGNGSFAASLGLIVESFVAEDLRLVNPGVEITVQI
ncbi:hypothetical protein UFOVP1492_114 [uncultured Caudovirales phage]|uniref:Uncharacterized protein n=1 Tax=uncultured Caudovirales phage TaxID=2100421 RepID=A0A6J5QUQ0_9CAUD|nr:hypothetical protein UFOVP1127_20 [uncultured Caudovirales phage]CAB4193288.1 hypothetical protein UFOVP1242_54 [uncultured Caudovirales phage]CAB4217876.1 hypothetical protein UFOVP1492_114 [uncultured Caudovirales phage]CAB5230972.1 hypothetical protein UFOVP1580_7 [uncultured Caudovirales phage]